jgi:hypothetical protein
VQRGLRMWCAASPISRSATDLSLSPLSKAKQVPTRGSDARASAHDCVPSSVVTTVAGDGARRLRLLRHVVGLALNPFPGGHLVGRDRIGAGRQHRRIVAARLGAHLDGLPVLVRHARASARVPITCGNIV